MAAAAAGSAPSSTRRDSAMNPADEEQAQEKFLHQVKPDYSAQPKRKVQVQKKGLGCVIPLPLAKGAKTHNLLYGTS